MIPSFNLKETFRFFIEILAFTPVLDTETYGILQKNNLTIHLLNAGEDIGQMEFYIEVDNVDKLWNSIKEKVKGISEKEPFDREYGMREIHIAGPFTNSLLLIGHER